MVGTTQSRILDLLKRDGPQASRALAAALGMTAVGVRQHLVSLERDGLVEHSTARGGRGRPRHTYMLTDHAQRTRFPAAYAELACDLLHEVQAQGGPDALVRVLSARMEARLAADARRVEGKAMAARLSAVAALQDAAGYMAEADLERGELVQRHCCIPDAARHFPALCAFEQTWIERLLGTRVERVAHQLAGDPVCRYRIREMSAEGDDRCS